jgi:hypothetical protein
MMHRHSSPLATSPPTVLFILALGGLSNPEIGAARQLLGIAGWSGARCRHPRAP